jgi:hypothetical protein
MQSLVLPRPISFLPTPLGHFSEPEDGLVKLRTKLSPGRPEQQSYPSPPMSEPHSPNRRSAKTSDLSRHSYHALGNPSHKPEAGLPLPSPSSAAFVPRSSLPPQGSLQQRQLFPGELHPRTESHYAPERALQHSTFGSVQTTQNYTYGYQPAGIPSYGGHQAGPMGQQAAMIAPPPMRPTKPARRTKAHVASACVNCKKAHLSCDVQRPCGRCSSTGKQVSPTRSNTRHETCNARMKPTNLPSRTHAKTSSTRSGEGRG